MSRIRLFPSGKEVDCAGGDTVLAALEKAGYALQNNCRAGACGECKVRIACLTYALDSREKQGVWGGASAREHRKMLRTRRSA